MTKHTTFTMHADDRSTWYIKTNDHVMIKRLEKVGAIHTKSTDTGRHYTIPAGQVVFRKPPRKLTGEEREAAAARMRAIHARRLSEHQGSEAQEGS